MDGIHTTRLWNWLLWRLRSFTYLKSSSSLTHSSKLYFTFQYMLFEFTSCGDDPFGKFSSLHRRSLWCLPRDISCSCAAMCTVRFSPPLWEKLKLQMEVHRLQGKNTKRINKKAKEFIWQFFFFLEFAACQHFKGSQKALLWYPFYTFLSTGPPTIKNWHVQFYFSQSPCQ